MIGHLSGKVLFSDGSEIIIQTNSGVGYQLNFFDIATEGVELNLFVSAIYRENNQELYGFKTLKEKKLFELLGSVKGVGPKSAYSLIMTLGAEGTINAIGFENKKELTKAPGIGAKAASQILLDLTSKIIKTKMYGDIYQSNFKDNIREENSFDFQQGQTSILNESLQACLELGFDEAKVLNIANKIMIENKITKPEQLVHLVLKEM